MEEVMEGVNNLAITEPHKKKRIQVSNTKKPLFFYVNLAKRYMQLHDEVELSALGMGRSDFTVAMPILSLTGTHENQLDGEQVVQVYCVQTMAIQQYGLELSFCLPPTADNTGLGRDPAISHVYERPLEVAARQAKESEVTASKDGNALRTKFLVEMLKYKDNESKDNIHEDIQELIRRVRI